MPARRIIPCLDVRSGRVVKGVRFQNHRDSGDILDLALFYRDEGADELVFYDITATCEERSIERIWIERIARFIDIPFTVAGGIRSVETAGRCFQSGADKISINSPALERPELIAELAEAFGRQSVVLGVDSCLENGTYLVKSHTGDPAKLRDSKKETLDWVREACVLGAGEIVLNCMRRDGTKGGYDIRHVRAVIQEVNVPVIASGGAGTHQHFRDLFEKTDSSGALAASIFHDQSVRISQLKDYLESCRIEVRH